MQCLHVAYRPCSVYMWHIDHAVSTCGI